MCSLAVLLLSPSSSALSLTFIRFFVFPSILDGFFFSQYSSFRVFIRKDDDNKIGVFQFCGLRCTSFYCRKRSIEKDCKAHTHTENEASKKSERKSYRRKIKVRKSFARTPRSIVACPYSLCCDLNASTVFYDWQCPCIETMPIFSFDLFALSSFLFFPPSVTLSHTRERRRKNEERQTSFEMVRTKIMIAGVLS